MSRRLIVNADDLGYSPGVTRGIIRAYREGIVTSTSLLVNTSYAADAVRAVQREAPQLGLGLHLTLTSGWPVLDASRVADLVTPSGVFKNRHECISQLDAIDPEQIKQELLAQVDRFIELTGHPPDHLDSHHHATYLSTSVAQTMMQIADDLRVPIRRPTLDHSGEAVQALVAMGAAADHQHAEVLVSQVEALVDDLKIRTPDHFLITFYDSTATLGDLLNLLIALPEGVSELMCHPGEVDEGLYTSSYVEGRANELAALTHPATRELVRAAGIELITFGNLHEERPE